MVQGHCTLRLKRGSIGPTAQQQKVDLSGNGLTDHIILTLITDTAIVARSVVPSSKIDGSPSYQHTFTP